MSVLNTRAAAVVLASVTILAHVLAAPPGAAAQAARAGDTFRAGALSNTRYSDIAYDPANDVYLAVAYGTPGGFNRSYARFITASGTPIGPDVFGIATSGVEAARPRAVYGKDQFLVTWFDWRATKGGQVYGRFLKYDPAVSAAVLGPEFVIGTARGVLNPETSAATAAYSSADDEFLVTWQDLGGSPLHDIRGQRVAGSGALLGGPINITFDNHYQKEPDVAYDRAANVFYVAWSNYTEPAGPAGVLGRRVQSGTGALLDTEPQLLFTAKGTWLPVVVNNPNDGNFFVGWYTNSPAPTHYGMLIGGTGAIVSAPAPVVVNYTSYDGFGVSHNPLTNTYFATVHSRRPSPPYEAVGQEILPTARPTAQGEFEITVTGARLGVFYPRVAASSRVKEWMAVASLEFSSLIAQRIQSVTQGGGGTTPPPIPPSPPPPDPTEIDFVSAPNGSEYFAEGYASSDALAFNTYYQVSNANDADATVRMYFAKQAGNGTVVLKERSLQVPARSRKTVDLRAQVGDGSWSAVFQSTTAGVPVTSQQSVFWGPDFEGSSTETAARQPATQWLFAEGSRVANDFFQNYFLLFNPGTQPITVLGEYFGPGATTPVVKSYTLPPSSRFTVFGNGEVPDLANTDFSVRFRSADGSATFVAQRAMYWGKDLVGGHSSNGTTSAQATWLFAEGASAQGFDTFFTLLNPNPFPVEVEVTYLTEAKGPVTRPKNFALASNSRGTIYANAELGSIGGFGTTFKTVGGHGIVVERSIYWGPGGYTNWVEGTNDVGVNAPSMSWQVPEGSDAGSFDSYLLIANPNAFAVDVLVQFFLETGGRITVPAVRVGAGARLTIDMSAPGVALPGLSASDAALLKGKAFAARVTSETADGPILVEGAMYRNWQAGTRWRSGGSAFGVPQ